MEVAYSKHGTCVSHHKYTLNLLRETGKLACKPVSTHVHPNVKLETGEDSPPVDRNSSQRLIGKSINLNHTRPNICFVASLLSKFMHHPH